MVSTSPTSVCKSAWTSSRTARTIAGRQQAASGSTKVLHTYQVADNLRMQLAARKARGLKEDYDNLRQTFVAVVEMSGLVDPEDIKKPETTVCWSILSCPTVHREGSRCKPSYMCPSLPSASHIFIAQEAV